MSTKILPFFHRIRTRKVWRGFSLIEAMVGIFIISVVIGGPMVIASRAAQDIRYSKEVFSATFLGEEAIELIRYKKDSFALECNANGSSTGCPEIANPYSNITVPNTGLPSHLNEENNEAAWRLFKNQFGYNTGTLCFSPQGCTFDILSILSSSATSAPVFYDASSTGNNACDTLYQDPSSLTNGTTSISAYDFLYLCAPHRATSSIDAQVSRIVKMTSTTTSALIGASYDHDYADTIKVDVSMHYKFKGFDKTITVTDFIRPRS
jgi:type II secretory pathway pseudopilin PulG